jgi:PAS domain S-box-containing protein
VHVLITHIEIRHEPDVVTARQRSRQIAGASISTGRRKSASRHHRLRDRAQRPSLCTWRYRALHTAPLRRARSPLRRRARSLTAEQQKQIRYIFRAANDPSDLVNDLLDIAKVESGKAQVNVSTFEVNELIATARALLRARRAESEAQRLAREWHTTFQAISDGICVLDAENTIQHCNQALAYLAGMSESAITQRKLLEILPQWKTPPVRTLLASQTTATCEFAVGERRFRLRLDKVPHQPGELAEPVCIATDITHLKQVEYSLRKAESELAHTHACWRHA